jgi:hypothetical protein
MFDNGYMYPKSVFPVTYVVSNSTYDWFKLIFEEEKMLNLQILCCFLINVNIVILETHARHHCLPMGSRNFSITKIITTITYSI